MTTVDPQAEAMAGLTTGLVTAIVHIFNCLDQRSILSKAEASASIRETGEHLPGEDFPTAKHVLKWIADGIDRSAQGLPGDDPAPKGPLLPIRPTLTIIPGGRAP